MMHRLPCFLTVCGLFLPSLGAIERKPIEDVDLDALISETQKSPAGQSDDHTTLVWWITPEFWQRHVAGDPTIAADPAAAAEMAQTLKLIKNYSVLGIVQADMTAAGTFLFYDEVTVLKGLQIMKVTPAGVKTPLQPSKQDVAALDELLDLMRPVLAGALGSLGQNLHFVVLDDLAADGVTRILDPYAPGTLEVTLGTTAAKTLVTDFPLPLDALFVPRKCPNGENAHISWKFCPWTGVKLPE